MLYKGTPKRNAKRIAEEIERNGGELNGFTDEAITAYWCKMPSRHLNVALEVLGDMVQNPLFDEKELVKERKVIFEEIKMRKDNPRIYVLDQIHTYLYERPFGIPLIGTVESMGSLTRADLLKRFNEVYVPKNMILTVVGDADFPALIQFIEKNFPPRKGTTPISKVIEKNHQKTESRKGVDQANLVFAYHVPTSREKKSSVALVLNSLLAGGMSSRLFQEIREKRNLAYGVKGDSAISRDYAYNVIYVGTTKENVEIVRKLIVKEFEIVANSLDEKELNQVKDQLIGNYQISMEDSQMQLVNLMNAEICGNAKEFYNFEKKIKAVKLSEVKKNGL